jgi:hypothetical protein
VASSWSASSTVAARGRCVTVDRQRAVVRRGKWRSARSVPSMGALEWSASCSGKVGGREERPWREVICSVDGGGKNTPAEQTIEVQ